jgi:UDP-3-O-[3-hydroxymyristoyl] glucosamine N-acyltransferase
VDPGVLTPRAVADLTGGRLVGDGSILLSGFAPLDRAGPGDLSFLSSGKYLDAFRRSRAGCVLVADDLAEVAGGPGVRIIVKDPARAMGRVLEQLHPDTRPAPGIDPAARLGPGVSLGGEVSVGPGAVLGRAVRLGSRVVIGAGAVLEDGVEIGDDSVIGPRVVCCRGTRVGRRVRIKPGAVIGGTGFGYTPGDGGFEPIPHAGRCLIEDDVDIGANTCIDRGSIDDTVIGAGTKIDNLVQVAHNVRIGKRCFIMSQVGVAGSARIGDGVILAGQVGVVGHLTVGDGARVAAQSGVGNDVPAGADYGGSPARPHREWLRSHAVLYRLAPLAKDLEALVKERNPHA